MIIPLPLPRHCPHIVIRQVPMQPAFLGYRLASFPCTASPRANGWCDLHQTSHEIMELGKELGYPCLAVNGSLEIGAGKVFWEAYAVVATAMRVRQIRAGFEQAREALAR